MGIRQHIERVQLRYFKYIFNLKNSTLLAMIYGELGVMPLAVDIKCRTFWAKIIGTKTAINYHMKFTKSYMFCENNRLKSQWISNLTNLICSLGFADILYSQSFFKINWFVSASCSLGFADILYSQSFFKINWFVSASTKTIYNIFIQGWFATIGIASSSNMYRLFKQIYIYIYITVLFLWTIFSN